LSEEEEEEEKEEEEEDEEDREEEEARRLQPKSKGDWVSGAGTGKKGYPLPPSVPPSLFKFIPHPTI